MIVIGKYGQTVFDISMQEYGTIEYIGDLIEDNNISLTEDLTGLSIIIREQLILPEKVKKYDIEIKQKTDNERLVFSYEGQTITNIALQEYGSLEFIKNIIQSNDVGLNTNLSGYNLIIDSFKLGNEKIKDYVISNKLKFNNKFDAVKEIFNFVYENGDNAVFENGDNQILE